MDLRFLAVSMKKIKDGVITREKKPDIGEMEMSAKDASMKEIVGKYRIYKSMGVVGGKFDLFTKDEIQEEMSKKLAAGEIDEDEAASAARMFEMIVEFTDDHEIVTWMKMPADLSEEQIKQDHIYPCTDHRGPRLCRREVQEEKFPI